MAVVHVYPVVIPKQYYGGKILGNFCNTRVQVCVLMVVYHSFKLIALLLYVQHANHFN